MEMDSNLKKKTASKTQTKQSFMDAFSREIPKMPLIYPEHEQRSLNAITMMMEYIRAYYGEPKSKDSVKAIAKHCRNLLALEHCNLDTVRDAVCQGELALLNECMKFMTGVNGIEVALQLKHSQFTPVRQMAEKLMDTCLGSQVKGEHA